MGSDVGEPKPQAKKGIFEKMSLFQKIIFGLLLLAIILVIVFIYFGGIKDFYQFFTYLVIGIGIIVGLFVIIKSIGLWFQPRYYSPREDLKTKLNNMAVDYKPDNVNNLYFVGDIGKKRVLAGQIVGLLGMPYFSGDIEKDKSGKVKYMKTRGMDGKWIPKYKNIREIADGDTLFVVKKGWFLFKKTHFIRCHRDFHSTLNGDVEIFDINPYPYGYFEYPYKQIQKSIGQITMQNQIETIVATMEHQHDLISQSVDSAIYFNPVYRYSLKQGSEMPEE
jgi:hypothetical protein